VAGDGSIGFEENAEAVPRTVSVAKLSLTEQPDEMSTRRSIPLA